ncbi:TRC40/GET3/ArsA family transport-energizing ATPase [Barrientosiimonas marina]|uniref:ArsA family ATPase n=1 Tax=Lentibacillus kimchii TaxID=1542911 RepID=A0ABW2USV3_9BACI
MHILEKKVIFVGGKGGVGKSTSAAALAWKAAQQGSHTLLVSTDPAHNLGDIFDQTVGGSITRIAANLDGLEIDPVAETEEYIKGVKDNIQNVVQASRMDEINRQLNTAKSSPGAEEAALFDRLISVILEQREHYDQLIFDTAPTGHTIRLLSLPELMGVWIEGMLKKRQKTNDNYTQLLNDGEPVEDPIYDVLKVRQDRFSKARDILLDDGTTGFVFVLNPDRLPIVETEKAIKLLDQYHLHVKTLIINKVLPENADGQFMLQRKEHEQQYLDLISETFSQQEKIYIPLFPYDIVTQEQLETYSYYFWEEPQKHESIRT